MSRGVKHESFCRCMTTLLVVNHRLTYILKPSSFGASLLLSTVAGTGLHLTHGSKEVSQELISDSADADVMCSQYEHVIVIKLSSPHNS